MSIFSNLNEIGTQLLSTRVYGGLREASEDWYDPLCSQYHYHLNRTRVLKQNCPNTLKQVGIKQLKEELLSYPDGHV